MTPAAPDSHGVQPTPDVPTTWRRRLVAVGAVFALAIVPAVVTGTVGTVTTADAAGLPVCAPGQEAVTAAGTGTPAPLGNLTGVPAALAGGGVFDRIAVDGEQLKMAATIVAVGRQMGITDRGIRVGIAVAAQQSSLRSDAVNGDWLGLFQQNSIGYTQYQRTDPSGAAWMFFQRLLAVDPGYDSDARTDWQIGDLVQLTTTGYRFGAYEGMAAAMVEQLKGSVSLAQDDAVCVPAPASAAAQTGSVFDPGNIVSDEVFYNTGAMSVDAIRAFIDRQGESCTGTWCLKNLRVTSLNQPADAYCQAYTGGVAEDAATVIAKVSTACGINPQVMLVSLQKESSLLDRTSVDARTYDAAWGWHCPDTGPGGSANCDPQYAGFFNQGYGMAKQWARYRVDPGKYNYQAGETVDILWNVAESGCGAAPVTIRNQATASLYNYTPYQPNAAALAAYPGTGDKCSAYGNRNFFYLFRNYFGSTGGGSTSAVLSTGPTLTIPRSPYVSAALAGQTITAPNAQVAKGLAAGFAALGLPYVWGGGGSGAGANNGCARGGGQFNSCGATIGFDCSGLTAYVLGQAGFTIPGDSGSQRAGARTVSWAEAQPGDVVGFPGHVAVYLGTFGGRPYILEASWVGTPVHIVPMTRTDADPRLYRFWDGPSSGTPVGGTSSTWTPTITPSWAAGLSAAGQAVSDAVNRVGGGTGIDPRAGSTTRPAGGGATAVASVRWIPRIDPVPFPTTGTGPVVDPRPYPDPVTEPTPAEPAPSPAAPPSSSQASSAETSTTAPPNTPAASTPPASTPPSSTEPTSPPASTTEPTGPAATTTAASTTAASTAAAPTTAASGTTTTDATAAPTTVAGSGTSAATSATTTSATTAPSTTAPATTAPATTAPATSATAPSTTAPFTTAPKTTAASTTAASTTVASTTAASTTAASTTAASTTAASTTAADATAPTTTPTSSTSGTTSTAPTTCPAPTTATSTSTAPTPTTTTPSTSPSAPLCVAPVDQTGPAQDRPAAADADPPAPTPTQPAPTPTGWATVAALPAGVRARRPPARRR